MKNAEDVIYLCSCVLNGATPDKEKIENMDLDAAYTFAARHMLAALVATAVESAGYRDGTSSAIIARALKATILFDVKRKETLETLERAGIWYMPVKGAVLKDLYPRYGVREMSDNDILFDAERRGDVRELMEKNGYETEVFGNTNQDVYYQKNGVVFEMHSSLFKKSNGLLNDYYLNIKERLVKDKDNDFGFHFKPDDLYIYITAHEYKHFSNCGTGLRSLTDTYLCIKKLDLDFSYIDRETEKLGISEFERANRSLATHLFGGEELTTADVEMLDYILTSGTYGTLAHRIRNHMEKNRRGKIRYMIHRLSVPFSKKNELYDVYAGRYPFFYKHKILLPFLPLYRLIRSVKRGRFKAEADAIKKA